MKKIMITAAVLVAISGPASAQVGFATGLVVGSTIGGREASPGGIPFWCFNASSENELRDCARGFVRRYIDNNSSCAYSDLRGDALPCSIERHLDLIVRGWKKP